MKKIIQVLPVVLLLAGSCGPKNEEVTDEQIETGPPQEVLDSIANAEKDAVKTDENNISPTFPLPQPVIALLSEKYPGWEEPELAPAAKTKVGNEEQGPMMVRGNFNNDTLQDYALQLQQGKEVVIVAIVQDATQNWNTYELQRDTLYNESGKLLSPYALLLAQAGTELRNAETGKETELPNDGVTITINNRTTTYVLNNGKFQEFNAD